MLQLSLQLQKQERQDRNHQPVRQQQRRGDGHHVSRQCLVLRGQPQERVPPLGTFLPGGAAVLGSTTGALLSPLHAVWKAKEGWAERTGWKGEEAGVCRALTPSQSLGGWCGQSGRKADRPGFWGLTQTHPCSSAPCRDPEPRCSRTGAPDPKTHRRCGLRRQAKSTWNN